MTAYAITKWNSKPGSLEATTAAIETYLETVTDSKTIRGMGVVAVGSGSFAAFVVHDA